MPDIYVTDGAGTPTLQNQVNLGSKTISKVYWGSTLKFQGAEVWNLSSGTNVNLETFLSGVGASASAPQVINLPVGVTVGSSSTATAAVVTGNLAAYTRGVTLAVYGEIQGAGGAAGADGGNAFEATTDITINNSGAIRAGGAGGGAGGTGGYGDTVSDWGSYQYETSSPRYYWHLSDAMEIYYVGVNYGPSGSTWSYKRSGSYMYNRGDKVTLTYYKIRRGTYYAGTAGTGGAGGVGQGYGQAWTAGAAGGNGTNRSGDGGDGGDGGNWGEDGDNGQTGGTGTYYSNTSSTNYSSGSSGTTGGSAGVAIDSGSATVTLLGSGVINGAVI